MTISLGSFYAILSSLIFFSYWLLVVITTLRIITRRRTTSYIMSWLLLIYIIPFFGVILYFLFGEIYLGKTRMRRAQKQRPKISKFIHQLCQYPQIFSPKVSEVAKPVFQLCKHQTGLLGITGNQVKLLSDANDVFNDLVDDINNAKTAIEMVFYIWSHGGRVKEIADALIRAAERDVKIHIMLDSAGSRHFLQSAEYVKLRHAGIQMIEVLKVNLFRFLFRRLDLRQHRKMIMIDNRICYTGSMNMVDPLYFRKHKQVGEWVDIMIRVEGPITMLMNVIYSSDWALETNHHLELPKPVNLNANEQDHVLQLVPSGPGYTENMIHQVLLSAIYAAQKQIILTTPYFVPSDDILYALCAAGQRGVEVIIILPKKNDSTMVKWASRAFYSELLISNVKIYEFQHNLLHTKSVLIDCQVSLIGTVNLDMRSLWLNFEITAVIDDNEFSKEMNYLLTEYLAQSEKIELSAWLKRPYWQIIIERIFYLFSPLL